VILTNVIDTSYFVIFSRMLILDATNSKLVTINFRNLTLNTFYVFAIVTVRHFCQSV